MNFVDNKKEEKEKEYVEFPVTLRLEKNIV
jgi:hypothetical protein